MTILVILCVIEFVFLILNLWGALESALKRKKIELLIQLIAFVVTSSVIVYMIFLSRPL